MSGLMAFTAKIALNPYGTLKSAYYILRKTPYRIMVIGSPLHLSDRL